MSTKSVKFEVPPEIGSVSARDIAAEKSQCIFTLAHSAGANMDHVFMETLAGGLSKVGIATLRFNFPFTENKKGRPDTPAVVHATVCLRSMIEILGFNGCNGKAAASSRL